MEALVIAAHGSHLHPGAHRPAYDHADRIRAVDAFDEIRAAFWKEEPSYREVFRTLRSEQIVVVPLYISEGYFTERIVPRELRLEGWTGWESDGTTAGHVRVSAADVDASVRYTGPVGTHDSMADVVIERAITVTGNPDVGEGVALVVVGHGTTRNENSAKAIKKHARRIRERERFSTVVALFMDEEPAIEDLFDHVEERKIVVVPLFVADGYHTTEDIPADIGLTPTPARRSGPSGPGVSNPSKIRRRRVWYSGAVGTEPRMAEVILERAADAGARIGDSRQRLRDHHARERGAIHDE